VGDTRLEIITKYFLCGGFNYFTLEYENNKE
jgi:hypothetical protein